MEDSDYSMYRFFKGEKENPFEKLLNRAEIDKSHLPPPECMKYEYNLPINEVNKLQSSKMFWFYESCFERLFEQYESSDWYAFFGKNGDKFMKLLSEKDYVRPSDKKGVFDMWLNDYLFIDKLYPEYGGDENWYKKEYYSISVQ
ncbi:MAG: hypothetical protein LBS43_12560 [Prevotellaceae bacterium]|jgi:hypothetical protein|nr:hypothetical protein [Prevotellaceae bacterium]